MDVVGVLFHSVSALEAAVHEHGRHVMFPCMQVRREGRLHDGAIATARGASDTAHGAQRTGVGDEGARVTDGRGSVVAGASGTAGSQSSQQPPTSLALQRLNPTSRLPTHPLAHRINTPARPSA
jgi:hypothetical protein